METTWQAAIQALQQDREVETIEIINMEYLNNEKHPQGGFIDLCPDGEHFDVCNTSTQEKRERLRGDQVEQALTDLNIANSDWL